MSMGRNIAKMVITLGYKGKGLRIMRLYIITKSCDVPEAAVREVLEERGHDVAICPEKADGQRKESDYGQKAEGTFTLRIEKMSSGQQSGFGIVKSGKDICLSYRERIDLFHGLGKLLGSTFSAEEYSGNASLCEESFHIESESRGSHGVLYDCSRNGVLRPERIKRYIRLQALMGLKCIYLYTEDTYEIKDYPYFGALRGRYKKEEIQECDEYARLYGVELIPCIQTLAHLRTALRWPKMMSYRDDKDILMVGEEETYRLIEAMLESVKEMYHSCKIHLGMDEAWYLGYGKYRLKYGPAGQGELIKRHLDRVMELCKKHGFEPMIWSDMFFVTAGCGDYYGVPTEYEWEENEKPDADIALVYWDYYGHDPKRYERMAALHGKLTDNVVFACGGWIWNGIAPNYAKAMDSMKCGFEGIRGSKVKDTFLTLWLDNGAETPMDAGLPMMAYYSRQVYGENEGKTKEQQKRETEQWFAALTGLAWKDMLLFDRFDHIPGTTKENREFANPSKMLFYQDILVGVFDGEFEEGELNGYYEELAERLEGVCSKPGKDEKAEVDGSGARDIIRADSGAELFSYYALLAKILSVKSDMGIRVQKAYLGGDREMLQSIAEQELPQLRELVGELRIQREKIWYREYKPNGYEVLDIRFAGVETRLRTAARRLRQYLDGEIGRIEELEEKRLPYTTEQGVRSSCNLWEHIVSGANIEGV